MEKLPHGNRRFYELPTIPTGLNENDLPQNQTEKSLLPYINANIIGKNKSFLGPFGNLQTVYCDYTASGRSLQFIEDFIQEHVLPVYGNTHTTTTVTSLQTTLFRHEARDIVRNAVNASEHDAVIFTGSGCTGAVHKLISALNLDQPPVVFCGPFEHHSNLLPWRELGSDVINIQETVEGLVDLNHLQHELKAWQYCGRTLIGCFAAASNITGVLVDVNKITAMLHKHGALSLWDYATAGPYVNIDMNPVIASEDQPHVFKDAVFISTHKFIGGIQTPGILVAKKKLFKNPVPSGCGGGSVFFVHRNTHRYLQEAEMREEGGTPAIVESIRAGLVFQLKEAVGSDLIMEREHQLCSKAVDFFKQVSNLVLLGPTKVSRLPIFSLMVQHPESGHYLHYNYVCALLNDIFGIQARGGCACAGPYGQDLLGISENLAEEIEDLLLEDNRLDRVHLRRYREYSDREILRPGFVRLNLPYFMDDETVDFVLQAIKMVAELGWKMLPQYNYNPETGEWRHRTHQVFTDRKWLGYVSYKEGCMNYTIPKCSTKTPVPNTFQDCLDSASKLFADCKKNKVHIGDQTLMFSDNADKLRWFLLPSEAYLCLQNPSLGVKKKWKTVPFQCLVYPKENPGKSAWTNCKCDVETSAACKIHGRTFRGDHVQRNNSEEGSANKQSEQDGSFRDAFMKKIEDNFICSINNSASNQNAGKILNQEVQESFNVKESGNNGELNVNLKNKDCLQGDVSNQVMKDGVGSKPSDLNVLDKPNVTVTKDPRTSLAEQDIPASGTLTNNINVTQDKKDADSSTTELFQMLSLIGDNLNDKAEDLKSDFVAKLKSKVKKSDQAPIPDSDDTFDIQDGKEGSCKMGKCSSRTNHKTTSDNSHGTTREIECNEVKSKSIWHPPYKQILKLTCEALDEYKMIQTGDRVLVCLSGGKDSLSLLHTLRQYQFVAGQRGIKFDLGAVTIDPQADSYDPSPLKPYLAELGVPYFYEEQCIMEAAKELPYECASICSYCSRMKRGRIYTAARREGYNVLAMGQHLDDLAESFLMSLFFNGITRTMKASYTVSDGDLRVVRPFVYVREKDLRIFAEEKNLPVIPDNCPACFEAPKERHRMKQLLASQEILHPRLFHSLKAALKPIMAINKTGCNVNTLLTQMNEAYAQKNENILDKL